MLNLPEDRPLEDVCNRNEAYTGGHFPIGNNECWHSGIHIFSNNPDNPVKSLTKGQLVAYRISDSYQTIPLLKEITGTFYQNLKDNVKKLYEESTENGILKYILLKESLTEREYSELNDTNNQNGYESLPQDLYQKDDSGNYIPVWKLTTNFVLLKHQFTMPKPQSGDGEEKKIDFYTLYMGLKPGVLDAYKNYYNTFVTEFDVDNGRPLAKALPFYQNWLLKITSAPSISYYETNDTKIFVGSHCKFDDKENDNEHYDCEFDNIMEDKKISIPKGQITPREKLRYIPKEDRISVYHIVPEKEGQLFKIGELKKTGDNDQAIYFQASYKNCAIERFRETHCEVAVSAGELYPTITKDDYVWWYKGDVVGSDTIKYNSSIDIFYQKKDAHFSNNHYKLVSFYDYFDSPNKNIINIKTKFLFPDSSDIEIEYDPGWLDIQLSSDKKMVSIKGAEDPHNEPKRIITLPPKKDMEPFVIIKNNTNPDTLVFYYNEEKVYSIPVSSTHFNTFQQSNNHRSISNSLLVVCLSKISYDRIKIGEYLNVEQGVHNGDNILPDYVQTGEKLHYCRLKCMPYLAKSTVYPVIVKKSDLKISKTRGYLNDASKPIAGLAPIQKNGVVLYDGSSTNSNRRDILPEGEEFIPGEISGYKSEPDAQLLPVLHKEELKYAFFEKAKLAAKIVYDEEYGGNNNAIKKDDKEIRHYDILGYPDEHFKQNYLFFYDMVCFFNDKSFLDDTANNENEETNLLNWKKHFVVEETDNKNDLFCDSANGIKEAIKQHDKEAEEAMEALGIFNGLIKCNSFIELYKQNKNKTNTCKPIIIAMRKLIVSHPLEWDKTLYTEEAFPLRVMSRQRLEWLQKEMELRDIWKEGGTEGIKDAVGNDANNFWFTHPVYFLNHLDKAGLLEGSVIPVESKYIMQDERWVRKDLPKTAVDTCKMEKEGCVVTLLANVACSLGKKGITPITILANEDNFENNGSGDIKWDTVADNLGLIAERMDGGLTTEEYTRLNKEAVRRCIGIRVPYNDANPQGLHWVGVVGTTSFNEKDWFIISPTSDFDSKEGYDRFTKAGWEKRNNDSNQMQVYVPVSSVTDYVKFSLKK